MRLICTALCVGIPVLLGGCAGMSVEDRGMLTAMRSDIDNLKQDVRAAGGRIESIEVTQTELRKEMNGLRASPEHEHVRKRIEDLDRTIRAVDTARESDRKEIVERLSQNIATVLSRQSGGRAPATGGSTGGSAVSTGGARASAGAGSAAGSAAPQGGGEHVVREGETLSAIAKQYGVKVQVIMDANKLKDANSIRPGKKLTIPK